MGGICDRGTSPALIAVRAYTSGIVGARVYIPMRQSGERIERPEQHQIDESARRIFTWLFLQKYALEDLTGKSWRAQKSVTLLRLYRGAPIHIGQATGSRGAILVLSS